MFSVLIILARKYKPMIRVKIQILNYDSFYFIAEIRKQMHKGYGGDCCYY